MSGTRQDPLMLRSSLAGLLGLALSIVIAPAADAKSSKRGVAYNITTTKDYDALSPGMHWWYNWSMSPTAGLPQDTVAEGGMSYVPMLWNGDFDDAAVVKYLRAHPYIHHLMVLNEPNVSGQAYTTPQQAAALWPRYEAVAAAARVKLVGPQITWGTMPGYQDPVAWLDAFYAAYQSNNNGRQPEIDYIGFHWYDYGIAAQLDRLYKYKKQFWVSEFANWHSQKDGAQIDTLAKQEAQMASMVSVLETRSDVYRYAWFTGRVSPDPHFDSLLSGAGQLTPLGSEYLSLPVGH